MCKAQSLVPHVAHIALSKRTRRGDLLNIWPLWYQTYTEEMLGGPSAPTHDRVSSLHAGSTDVDTADRQQIHGDYYTYARYDDEATSGPRGISWPQPLLKIIPCSAELISTAYQP